MNPFSTSFVSEEVINTKEEDFDPFNIGVAPAQSSNSKTKSPKTAANDFFSADFSAAGDDIDTSTALPPRVVVKFQLQEEVSSVAHSNDEIEGCSDVQIEGTLMAQVVSSDALKNVPFFLLSSTDNQKDVEFLPNKNCAKSVLDSDDTKPRANISIVEIPKETLGFVNVGNYRISQSLDHMPLMLEQKVVRSKSKIQIAIQVRSKLSNPDHLSDFSIVLFIPKELDGKSIEVLSGDGEFDRWKRCITWEKQNLPKGHSFMVSAKCDIDDHQNIPGGAAGLEEMLKFPLMLRCQSKDQISSARFKAVEANGYPASVSSSVVGKSFRIVHRLK